LTKERAPRRGMTAPLSSAVFALVAAAWIHPALSATGSLSRCDRAIDDPPAPVADGGGLALRVLGHNAHAKDSSKQSSPAETDAASVPTPELIPVEPRVDAVLRSTARERLAGRLQPEKSGDRGAPLLAEKAEGGEEPTRLLDAEQTEAAVERPRYADDDLVRSLQRQMYRTDI
jgi:hypothetical protein